MVAIGEKHRRIRGRITGENRMTFKPWYKIVTPREDLRQGKPLDASEFAVHLDQVRDGRAPEDYQQPARFFDRTYLTTNLTDLAAQVVRRLSGERTETSAVFNLATQFGGGKTHALALLYHLAKGGPAANQWTGVSRVLDKAGIQTLPQAAVAVFVGTEFDSLTGRGGKDGADGKPSAPLRKTPWGEIAYQLGGEESLAVLAEHEKQFIEPKGDVIRNFLPKDRPCLILMDEIINYVSTYRGLGYHNKLYNFIQSLSETARGQDNVVLVVSIPASELEYTSEDEADEQRFKKMLDRLGKAVLMSAESETAEIIRRRLFEWDTRALTQDGRVMLSQDAHQTCREYADWVMDHRLQLPSWFNMDGAYEAFQAAYPFHPTVLSVFERKWQVLPRFQRTRGILRLLALWVARAYQEGYKGAHRDALIGPGTAPLDDPNFRAAVFEQLGESRLEGAVTTDICGKKDSQAARLDEEAVETIRKARLHRKAASTIFFESNGGQARGEATTPEIRLGIAEPDLDIGNAETVLEALRTTCYFLTVEGNRYRFSTTPNLNKLLADRRANVQAPKISEQVRSEVQKVFAAGSGVERVYFPEASGQISDRAVLTLVVLSPEQALQDDSTLRMIERMTREVGTSGRTFKSALLWMVAEDDTPLRDDARQLLAWELIDDEYQQGQLRLDEIQARQLRESLGKAKRDLKESAWRAYKNIVLLGKDNQLRIINLGLVHSSAADSLVALVLNRLRQDCEIEDSISPNFLVRNWPAFPEWSTKAVRDAFFAAPLFPRLSKAEAIKDTIARGVSAGLLGYVGKTPTGKYAPFIYKESLSIADVEISEDVFIITGQTAEKYLSAIHDGDQVASVTIAPAQVQVRPGSSQVFTVQCFNREGELVPPGYVTWSATGGAIDPNGIYRAGESEGKFVITVQVDKITSQANVTVKKVGTGGGDPPPLPPPPPPPAKVTRLSWNGEIPAQKWMNFYTRVLSRFALGHKLKLSLHVEVSQDSGISEQKIEETKGALRELGLGEEIKLDS
jgi:hypothetical protein